MKKFLLTALTGLLSLTAAAGTLTMETNLPIGSKVKILLNTKSATNPVTIDWGNGVAAKYTVDPSQMAYNRWIEGTIEGPSLIITGNLTEAVLQEIGLTKVEVQGMNALKELDLSKNAISDFQLKDLTPLEDLDLSHNNLANTPSDLPMLTLENAGESLTNLNLSHNSDIQCVDIRYLESLEYFSANDCPKLASVFICMPEESRPALRSINLSNCVLMHFYPVNLPELHVLDLGNNQIISTVNEEPFDLSYYPELTQFNISNNAKVNYLDLSKSTKLEMLGITGNLFTTIDLSQCPELGVLSAADNKFTDIDFGNNKKLRSLYLYGNPFRKLDTDQLRSLETLDVSNTQIERLMLMNCSYLTSLYASGTNLEFVDFNGQQASRMNIIDLRDNPRMTGETVDYTIHTLPEARTFYGDKPTLLLAGSNAETADIDYATSSDMKWICDIEGDGSAKHSTVAVTLQGATDTGENVTGHLDRLYPIFGMGMDYDFDRYQTDGGTFLISQWQPQYFQQMANVAGTALTGVPIHIQAYPEEGKKFKSVTVNGREVADNWFVIDGEATIKVNFSSEDDSFSFTTTPGTAVSMLLNTVADNGTVWVDWGTGNRTEYTGMSAYTSGNAELGGTRIDGTAAGETVTLYGDIAGIDLSGYGDAAEYFGLWDNKITAVNIGQADNLKFLSLYWNPVAEIDLSGAPNLEVLNVSYTDLKTLDLSSTPGIMWLEAYSDGYGEDGISQLSAIDVTGLKYLQYLDVKSNKIPAIDLSQNEWLTWAFINNNEIASVDLSHNPMLTVLNASGNQLTAIDLSHNPELTELSVGNNKLTSLDLKANTKLTSLSFSENNIKSFDASPLKELRQLWINGNGMDAEQLNDLYYLLPQRPEDEETADGQPKMTWNLAVIQGTDPEENLNDGTRADSSIAIDRGWTPSHTGTNGGSDTSYLDILPAYHGAVVVEDAQGNQYGHGSKVPKYAELRIVATPEEGYRLLSYTLNGEDALTEPTFEMPGIYTKLRATFTPESGVDSAAADGISIIAGRGILSVAADDCTLDVINAEGRILIASDRVAGSASYSLPAGVYAVRTASASGTAVRKVIVK